MAGGVRVSKFGKVRGKGFSMSKYGGAGLMMGAAVTGLPMIIKNLKMMSDQYSMNMMIRLNRIGIMLQAEAIRLVKSGYYRPAVDTGHMWKNIMYIPPKNVNPTDLVLDFGTSVYYAIYVHEGTKWMVKRPFIIDAVKNKRKEILTEMNAALTGVGGVGGGHGGHGGGHH